MGFLGDLRMYARFGWQLPGFLKHVLTLEEARATVRQRLADRETNFLQLVEKGIFGYRRSPYRMLFDAVGCELGDVTRMIRSSGLEGTLRQLRQAGVFVTFEEFKGRTPLVRNGRTFNVTARDFRNPYLSASYPAQSSGTTGAGTRVDIDLDNLAAQASQMLIAQDAHGVAQAPMAVWRSPLPDGSGIANILRAARFGNVPMKWFSPTANGDLHQPALRFRLATAGILAAAHLSGRPIPRPEVVPMDQAGVIARWAIVTRQARGACVIRAHVSMALRVSLAAQAEGVDLAGVTFMSGGEPPTPAKVAAIRRSGAGWLPVYVSSDVGWIGAGCARPVDGNDLHLFTDGVAVIESPRQVPGSDEPVQALCFTSLLGSSPMLLLNVESDDCGVIEHRHCGCPLEACGLTGHVREVRSFRKLTGEGVTLIGTDMVRILEEVLPGRFGGSPLDYQLVEEEDERGYTRLVLVISPGVRIDNESAVVETVLAALRATSVAADLAAALWSQAGTLRIRRAEPAWTDRGKFMTLDRTSRARGEP